MIKIQKNIPLHILNDMVYQTLIKVEILQQI